MQMSESKVVGCSTGSQGSELEGKEQQDHPRKERQRDQGWIWSACALAVVLVTLSMSRLWPPEDSPDHTSYVEDYERVNYMNEHFARPSLQNLVKKPFLRYFKVKLWKDCSFWPDDDMCSLRDCSVSECPEEEIPDPLRKSSSSRLKCREENLQAAIDRTLGLAFVGWAETDNPWTDDNEAEDEGASFVDLLLNPQRYTGYSDTPAHRVWDAIHKINCFKDTHDQEDVCAQKRVLYRLMSGLHTSISVHIARDYLLDEITNKWGPNITSLHERVLDHPDRVQDMYFAFLFVLRALRKASEFLARADYDTGNSKEDIETQSAVRNLVRSKHLTESPFDESLVRSVTDENELKMHFRNISALMDCVGCEKCRLWGKLQILGFATAFKILFSAPPLDLQRNEVTALVNLLARLSDSVEFVTKQNRTKPLLEADKGTVEVHPSATV